MLNWNDHGQRKARKITKAVKPQNPAHLPMVSYLLDSELPSGRSEKENIITVLQLISFFQPHSSEAPNDLST